MPESPADRLRRIADRASETAEALVDEPARPSVEAVSSDRLAEIALDRGAATEARIAAIVAYRDRYRSDPEAGDLLLRLLDDPDESVAIRAIGLAPPFDGRVLGRLRILLDDDRPRFREAAARELGRRKDRASLPTLGAWFHGVDEGRRRAALGAIEWLLSPPEWLAFLDGAIRAGARDEAEMRRFEALLPEAGRRVATPILRELAESEGPLSSLAATLLAGRPNHGGEDRKGGRP